MVYDNLKYTRNLKLTNWISTAQDWMKEDDEDEEEEQEESRKQ